MKLKRSLVARPDRGAITSLRTDLRDLHGSNILQGSADDEFVEVGAVHHVLLAASARQRPEVRGHLPDQTRRVHAESSWEESFAVASRGQC